MRRPFLGCIADDVTGASDLASNLVLGGMRTVQVFGVPDLGDLQAIDADAVVVALKSRSIPSEAAIEQSLTSLKVLQEMGAQRIFFKYCSTFDSTDEGNIGPVAEALMQSMGCKSTIFCPAFPRNGRSVYQGHLFVGNRLLNESGMEDHPLNPMRESDLVRVLQKQVSAEVGLIDYEAVVAGRVTETLERLAKEGKPLAIVDACEDAHLELIAREVADNELLTGGSGIARYLPKVWRVRGFLEAEGASAELPRVVGRAAILAGSCSTMTQKQVAFTRERSSSFAVDVEQLMQDLDREWTRLNEFLSSGSSDPILIYSTSSADTVDGLQQKYGFDVVAQAIESFFAKAAQLLVEHGNVRKLVLAGGETSGAVIQGLKVKAITIGPEICAGVPWTQAVGDLPLALALKSGNFGEEDFFERALEMLP